jgi:hypothetical protein
MQSSNVAEQWCTLQAGMVAMCPLGWVTTETDRTYRPSLHGQLPQKLIRYLLVQVPDVARGFLVAILCMLTNQVGSNTSCDAATGRGHTCEVLSLQNSLSNRRLRLARTVGGEMNSLYSSSLLCWQQQRLSV